MLGLLKISFHLCLLLLFAQSAQATCNIESVLESAFQSHPLHPPAYRKLVFSKPQQLLEVHPGSISEKSLEPLQILQDSDSMQMGVNEFKTQFEKLRKKPMKDRYDYINFYESRYQIYRSAMTDFLTSIKKLDPARAPAWEKTVQEQTSKIHQIYKRAKGESRGNYVEIWQEMHNNIMGSTAELQTGLNIGEVDRVSLKLNDFQKIKQNLNRLLNSSNHETILSKDSEFPHIFNNPLIGNAGESKRSAIEKWILSKEIDVVHQSNGKTAWLEVKRNSNFIRYEDFIKKHGSTKSYMDQILETQEILKFTELDHEIQLEYLATGGMDAATRRFLESNGIKVLNP